MTALTSCLRRWWPLPLLLLAAWIGGFAWFLWLAERPAASFGRADGIVVLTGGAERVEEGLRLLSEDRAAHLLISGIGGKAELSVIAHGSGIDTVPLADRVRLGREAMSTHGNALETASWVNEYHVRTLIVVTAWFHMPRALSELHRMLPDVVLLPEPVHAQRGAGRPGPGILATGRLLLEEYSKYLIALTGLTGYLPGKEATHS
jgi:uncharacterized SAM-binding protein YcdF (DUF218 family)